MHTVYTVYVCGILDMDALSNRQTSKMNIFLFSFCFCISPRAEFIRTYLKGLCAVYGNERRAAGEPCVLCGVTVISYKCNNCKKNRVLLSDLGLFVCLHVYFNNELYLSLYFI